MLILQLSVEFFWPIFLIFFHSWGCLIIYLHILTMMNFSHCHISPISSKKLKFIITLPYLKNMESWYTCIKWSLQCCFGDIKWTFQKILCMKCVGTDIILRATEVRMKYYACMAYWKSNFIACHCIKVKRNNVLILIWSVCLLIKMLHIVLSFNLYLMSTYIFFKNVTHWWKGV